jgi:hypothetical protein
MQVITTPRKKKMDVKKKLTPRKENKWCCQDQAHYSMLLYDAVRKLLTCVHVCVLCGCISGQALHGWSYVCWIETNLCVLYWNCFMCVGLNLIHVCWMEPNLSVLDWCMLKLCVLDCTYLSMSFNLSYIGYMLSKFIILEIMGMVQGRWRGWYRYGGEAGDGVCVCFFYFGSCYQGRIDG